MAAKTYHSNEFYVDGDQKGSRRDDILHDPILASATADRESRLDTARRLMSGGVLSIEEAEHLYGVKLNSEISE